MVCHINRYLATVASTVAPVHIGCDLLSQESQIQRNIDIVVDNELEDMELVPSGLKEVE